MRQEEVRYEVPWVQAILVRLLLLLQVQIVCAAPIPIHLREDMTATTMSS